MRVTQKTRVKTWSNARGDGRVFSCDFLDDSVSFLRLLMVLGSKSFTFVSLILL